MTAFVSDPRLPSPTGPAREAAEPGELPERLVDGYGRVHTNLRISITDRCNFRCVYCMPEDVRFYPKEHILTYEEIARLTRLFVRLGVDKVRLTGGEPTVRRDLPALVRELGVIPGLRDLSMTTNGVRLKEMAADLHDAGLRRVNVSLDSLDRDKFRQLARRDGLEAVLEGLWEAARVGFHPVKVNVVALRHFTEPEVLSFARLARDHDFHVRFIEFMPLDGDDRWNRDRVLDSQEILDRIHAVYPLERVSAERTVEPAERYRFVEGRGEIGIIPTISSPFCDHCNRLRLTADGKLRYCLFAVEETDLKGPLREGATDEELGWLIADTVRAKWRGHLISQAGFVKPERHMSQIGG